MTQILAAAAGGIIFVSGILFLFRKKVMRRRERNKDLTLNSNLQQLISQDQYEYFLIDVRSDNEYRKGHIPTSVHVPYGRLGSYLPSDNLFSNIIVYGRSHLQSSRAASILEDSGYFNVTGFGPFFRWKGPVSRVSLKSEQQKKSS